MFYYVYRDIMRFINGIPVICWTFLCVTDYSLSQTLVFINKSLSWRDAWGLCHNNFSGYLLPHVPPASWYDDGCTKKHLEELGTFWLGQSSNFTPFIAHQGCFSVQNSSSNAFKMETPSVAYCHYKCGSLKNINFGIMNKHTCICIKNKTSLTHENKEKCNEICKTPISDDEYCGGDGVVNHYRFHGEPTQPASFNFCGFVSCGDRNIQKTNCSALKGRICGDKMHQDKLPFASSRNKCGNEYLRSVDTFINCTNNTQGHFWMDIKRYEYWKPDSLKKEKIKGTTVRCLAFNSSSSVVHACRETFASVCISHSNIIDDKTPTCPQPTPQDFPTNPSVLRDNTGTGANPGIYAGISTGLVILICLSVILIVYLRRKSGEVTDKSERKSENAKAPLQITNHLEEDVYVHQAEGVYDELNKSRMKVNTNHDTNIYDTGHGDEDEGVYSKTGNNGATTGSCSEYGVCGKEVSGGEQIEDKEGMYSKMHEQVANVMQCSEYDICGTVTTCDGDISNTE